MNPSPRISLGPLQGITVAPFRAIFFDLFDGYDASYAPFIKAVSTPCSDRHYRDILGGPGSSPPLIPQILCKTGPELRESARRIAGYGYGELNINMGCPFPMVASKGRGSGLLDKPDQIDRMLGEGLAGSPLKVSVKLRLGRNSKDEMHRVVEVLNRHELCELILHPRTGIQMYQGRVDLEAFGEFLALSRHPVAYNGDIRSLRDIEALSARFPGVSHWMLCRGALMNPFLASEAKGIAPEPGRRREALARYHERYLEAYVSRFGRGKQALDVMKGFWSFLAYSFAGAEGFLARMRRLKGFERYDELVEEIMEAPLSIDALSPLRDT